MGADYCVHHNARDPRVCRGCAEERREEAKARRERIATRVLGEAMLLVMQGTEVSAVSVLPDAALLAAGAADALIAELDGDERDDVLLGQLRWHACSCGHVYARSEWERLERIGDQVIPAEGAEPGYSLEQRNCRYCGSTRSRRVQP